MSARHAAHRDRTSTLAVGDDRKPRFLPPSPGRLCYGQDYSLCHYTEGQLENRRALSTS